MITLSKAHALGNDFLLLLDPDAAAPFDAETARRVCERHRGIGADGLIHITKPGGQFRMDLRNADGGVAEISGNGLRCVARLLHVRGLVEDDFVLDTAVGPRRVVVSGHSISASMGVPHPMDGPRGPAAAGLDFVAVSLGNPHVVVFVDDVDAAPVAEVGRALEHDPAFPERTNVEFARPEPPSRVVARIWERGVGETEASGSGGCACAVAARLRHPMADDMTVSLPGGELAIHWEGEGLEVIMTGPAQLLFDTEVDPRALG